MNLLGRTPPAGVGYQCPNRACGWDETVWLAPLSRPRLGKPWKHDPVGSMMRCARCGCVFCVSVNRGVYEIVGGSAATSAEPASLRQQLQVVPGEGERLEDLMSDMRLGPNERGV